MIRDYFTASDEILIWKLMTFESDRKLKLVVSNNYVYSNPIFLINDKKCNDLFQARLTKPKIHVT